MLPIKHDSVINYQNFILSADRMFPSITSSSSFFFFFFDFFGSSDVFNLFLCYLLSFDENLKQNLTMIHATTITIYHILIPKTTPAASTAMNQGLLKASSAMVAWHINPVLLNFLSFLHEHFPSYIL